MATITVTLVTAAQDFPAGTVAGGFRVSLAGSANTVSFDSPDTAFVFDGVDPGDYTLTAALIDSSGSVLGTSVTQSVTVEPGVVSLQVPVDMVVAVA
jgi:hypothetical protein